MESIVEDLKREKLFFSVWEQEKPCDLEKQLDTEKEMMNTALAELAKRSAMQETHQKGEQKYGPPIGYTGIPPSNDLELFIGGLPRDCYKSELVSILERVGSIFEMRLMMNSTGHTRGYAFVKYQNPESAAKAVEELNGYEIRKGRRIAVLKSIEKKCLFIGNIPNDKKREDIYQEISKVALGVLKVNVPKPIANFKHSVSNRGFAFIEFQNHSFALSFLKLVRCTGLIMWDTSIKVKWAEHRHVSRAITITNLSPETLAKDLEKKFNSITNNGVVRVDKIFTCAMVYFQTRNKAIHASQMMNKKLIDGSPVNIQMQPYISNANK